MIVFLVTLFNFFAAILSGCTGFGMSTITTPFLVNFFSVQEVFLFTGLTHAIGSLWILLFLKKDIEWGLLFWFGIPSIIGSFLGSHISLQIPQLIIMRGMGLFLILYVVLMRWCMQYRFAPSYFLASIGGFLSGFFAGIFGFSGAIRTVFLQSFLLSHQEYIVMSHIFEFFIDATRSAEYYVQGVTLGPDLYISFLWAPITLILGAYLVKMIMYKVPRLYFEHLVTLMLLLEAVRLMLS